MNERLKPEDSGGELINSLSGSHMFSLWGCHVMNERLKPEYLSDKRWGELIID